MSLFSFGPALGFLYQGKLVFLKHAAVDQEEAVQAGHLELVKRDKAEGELVHGLAAECGHLNIVKHLIKGNEEEFYQPLSEACYHGQLKVAKYIISLGLETRFSDQEPLLRACLGGHLSMVKLLASQPEDISVHPPENMHSFLLEHEHKTIPKKVKSLGVLKYLALQGMRSPGAPNFTRMLSIKELLKNKP